MATWPDHLSASIRLELSAIELRIERNNEERHIRNASIAQFVASLAIPIGWLLAFFGINASQVQPTRSMFDLHAYWLPYAIAILVFATPPVLVGISYRIGGAKYRRQLRRQAEERNRRRAAAAIH